MVEEITKHDPRWRCAACREAVENESIHWRYQQGRWEHHHGWTGWSRAAIYVQCRECGRLLAPRADGLTRMHGKGNGHGTKNCPGSGHKPKDHK